MIERIRNYAKKNPSRDAHKIYVVCEGAAKEPEYFSFFQGLSHNLEIIPIPPTSGTDPLKLIENAESRLVGEMRQHTIDYMQGDTVWFVFDTDTWETEGKIDPLHAYCDSKNQEFPTVFSEAKAYHAWNYAQSNPCFEIWLYYHVYAEKPALEDEGGKESFKQFVDSSIAGGFNCLSHPVYLEDAIINSERNFGKDKSGKLTLYSTEMFNLGKEILPFVKRELDKLRHKLR